MELSEILDRARAALDDRDGYQQWTDADLIRWANDAVSEACLRTRVLQDATSAVTQITLVANTASYALDPCIFAVRRVRISGEHHPLELVDVSQLDETTPGWGDDDLVAPDTPRYACFDYGTGQITFVPTPSAAGTAKMLVWRGPTTAEQLVESVSNDAEPIIPEHMHRELFHWVAAQAYLNPDQETANDGQAKLHLGLFEQAYGEKPSLHAIRQWSTQRRRRVRPFFD